MRRQMSVTLPARMPGVSPDTVLPMELWDCIFKELPTDPLLSVSLTCRAFNELCMPLYLFRIGISSQYLASGDFAIDAFCIKSLQLSFYIPIVRLACAFMEEDKVYGQMQSLRSLIRRSKSIRTLGLTFVQKGLSKHLGPGIQDPKGMVLNLDLFRDIVYTMAEKFNGPAVIVSEYDIFTSRPRDIQRWKFHKFHFSGGVGNHIRTTVLPPSLRPRTTVIRLHDGTSAGVTPIHSIHSTRILEIPSITRRPGTSSTLIILNPPFITNLSLGRSADSSRYCIPVEELEVVLPCLSLPNLDCITLNTDRIDPVVLSQFLVRHEIVRRVFYSAVHTEGCAGALVALEITMLELCQLHAPDPQNMICLLDAFGTSPRLSELHFTHDSSSRKKRAALSALMHRLSQHQRLVLLRITLKATAQPLDDEQRAVARSLECVQTVHLACAEPEDVRSMIPWLELLPRLQYVRLWLGSPTMQARRVAREAMDVLSARVDVFYDLLSPVRRVVASRLKF